MASLGGSSSSSKSKPLKPKEVQGYYNQLNANSGGRLADFAMNGTQPTQYTGIGASGRVTAPQAQASSVGYQPLDFSARLQAPTVAPAATAGYQTRDFNLQAPTVAPAATAGYQTRDLNLQAPTVGPAATVAYQGLTPERVTALGGLGALREQQARRGSQQTLAQYAADPGLSTFQKFRADQLERQDLGSTLDALASEREAAITQMLADQQDQTLRADLANQAVVNQNNQFGASLGLDFQKLLAGATGEEQGRILQAALADQAAVNQNNQFGASLGLDFQKLLAGATGEEQGRILQTALANQAALNQNNQFGASLGLDFQKLLGGLTDSEQSRVMQAALANQSAANQTSQFNAGQQATADQFNAATALTEAQRKYLAEAANAGLSRADMQALASIFFGGTGNTTNQSQSSPMFSGGDVLSAGALAATFL